MAGRRARFSEVAALIGMPRRRSLGNGRLNRNGKSLMLKRSRKDVYVQEIFGRELNEKKNNGGRSIGGIENTYYAGRRRLFGKYVRYHMYRVDLHRQN